MPVLEDYKVNFFIPANLGRKFMTSTNPWLSQFVRDHHNVETANNLLAKINNVLSGQISHWVGINQSMQVAHVDTNETKIYMDLDEWEINNNINPEIVLPTAHLKIIVEAWINYLQQ